MHNIKIRSFIGLLTTLVSIICFVVGFTIVRDLQLIRQILEQNQKVHSAALELSYLAKINVVQVQTLLTGISATRAQNGLNQGIFEAKKAHDEFELNIERLLALDFDSSDKYQAIQPLFEAYYRSGLAMSRSYLVGGTISGNQSMPDFYYKAFEVDAKLNEIQLHIKSLVERDDGLVQIIINRQDVILSVSLIMLMGTIILIAVSVIRWMVVPIERVTRSINQVSRIEWDGTLPEITETTTSYRELQQLSDAFGSLARQLFLYEQENKALLATLNLHLIVSVTDTAGRIISANDSFCHISGYARSELLGQNHRIIRSDEQSVEFWTTMWKTVSAGKPWRAQVRNRTKDGSHYWVDTQIAPFFGVNGKIEKYIAVRFDITTSKAGEEAMLVATQVAESSLLAKSQFVANISHELRTPMNAILGMLALLGKTGLNTRQNNYVVKIDRAARSLLGLLNEILDFSKIEAGKMSLDPLPFSFERLLRDVSDILGTSVDNKPVNILFDIDPLVPTHLVGDATRIRQILLNLGNNAIKFTSRGVVILAIRVLHRSKAEVSLEFSVSDTGIGIAIEDQVHIFGGFTQADSTTTRLFGGTGLGLGISGRFVEQMGGDLTVDSIQGKGSRFAFCINLAVVDQANIPAMTHEDHIAEQIPCRVLLVDDSSQASAIVARMAHSLGWSMDFASSSEQALQMLRQQPPEKDPYQIVLVEQNLSGSDGWNTCRQISRLQQEKWQADHLIPARIILMVSAFGKEELLERNSNSKALGVGFAVKPITASMLSDTVSVARKSQNPSKPAVVLVPPTTQGRLNATNILLVEDNPVNQQVAKELLIHEGARVEVVGNGAEAVAIIGARLKVFDAVMMDIQMPVMDGFEATRRIRQELGQADLPIIAMTANVLPSDVQDCLEAGMNSHLSKPFDIDDLVVALNAQLGKPDPSEPAEVTIAPAEIAPGNATQIAADAGVDLSAALERLGGMQDLYRNALVAFVEDLSAMPGQLGTYAQNSQQKESRDDAHRLMHTLKGLAATIGATALSTAAASGEQAMRNSPDEQQVVLICDQVGNAITRALPGLQALSAVV
jgi:two-component system sensor histidine kinase/response regulator